MFQSPGNFQQQGPFTVRVGFPGLLYHTKSDFLHNPISGVDQSSPDFNISQTVCLASTVSNNGNQTIVVYLPETQGMFLYYCEGQLSYF